MASGTADVVIIGAGAIGCSIAYHLTRKGVRDVLVLERDWIGAGSTSKAAGGIRVQFSTATEIQFSLASIAFFERFPDEMEADCGYRHEGYLFVLTNEADLARYRRDVELQRSFGADVRLITPDEIRAIAPDVRVDDVLMGVWCATDGYAIPNDVVQAYARQARRGGARIMEETPVQAITVAGDRVAEVVTSRGRIATPLVINAAGPQAPLVGRMVGLELPVDPRRRHIFVTDALASVRHPMPMVIDQATGFYCRSEQNAVLMSPGDVGAVAEYECGPRIDWDVLETAVNKAIRRVPALETARVRNAWSGLRPLTPDQHAIVDWAPGLRGLYLAIGFGGHGFQHSPATGQVVAEEITGREPSIDLGSLRLSRFADGPHADLPRPTSSAD